VQCTEKVFEETVLPLNEQLELIRRGVEEIVPEADLEERIRKSIDTGKPMHIKYGIDPTGSDVHIGHMVPISKMRDFQDAGHLGIIIIGDYTAQIGDPTGRDESRPALTIEKVHENAATYVEQLMKVLDRDKTKVVYQTEWFKDFGLADMIRIGHYFTVGQMLSHDTFAKRMEQGLALSMHELFYPMLQAYDSYAIEADVELGGMEQRFNILQGRDLQRALGQTPQIAVLSPMLPGIDGGVKMGKSLANYIGVNDAPADMFGKVMSIPDDLIVPYYTLGAGASPDEIADATDRLKAGNENPRDIKRQLGSAIVRRYHDEKAAEAADAEFMGVYSRRDQLPDDMPDVTVPGADLKIIELMQHADLAPSRSEARRLVKQGGVSINGEKITDTDTPLTPVDGAVLRVGKRRFARIRVA
jgi:tyrosyl-tRNA synthetase